MELRVWEDDQDRGCTMQNPQRINQMFLKKKKKSLHQAGGGESSLTSVFWKWFMRVVSLVTTGSQKKKEKKKTTEEASVRVGGLSFSFHENVNSQRKDSSGLETAPGQGVSILPHKCPLRNPKKGAPSFSWAFKIQHS